MPAPHQPYLSYKPSGIEWLGEVPEHWEVKRLKHLAKIQYGLGQPPRELPDGIPIIRATNIHRGKINPSGMIYIDPKDVPYQRDAILKANDILVVRSGAYTGDSAIVPLEYEGAVAGYDLIVRVWRDSPRFIAYSLLSRAVLQNQIDLCRLRAAQPHLNAEELSEILFFIPPRKIQDEIVRFLDQETARIDAHIAKKRRLIELLKEKRTALITCAVTKGLDPNVPMKNSGIERLGKIPEHWEVKRLKYIAGINQEALKDDTYPDYLIRYVDISNVDSNGNILNPEEMEFDASPSRARRKVRNGDTIISTVRTYLKAIAYLDAPPDNMIVSTGFAVLRPLSCLHPKFFSKYLQSKNFVDMVVANSEGVSYPAINPTRLATLAVLLPPLSEQRAIADFLDRETARIDALVAKVAEAIAKLKEYRTALITAAVTGKIDVRGKG